MSPPPGHVEVRASWLLVQVTVSCRTSSYPSATHAVFDCTFASCPLAPASHTCLLPFLAHEVHKRLRSDGRRKGQRPLRQTLNSFLFSWPLCFLGIEPLFVPLLTPRALTLYLDFLNLFLSVLRVVSSQSDQRWP